MNEAYPCWYAVQIRFRDLDPLAHVNNTVYFTYFEEARSYYFSHLETWLKEWPSREEHQEVESIVSHPPHNPRIYVAFGAFRYRRGWGACCPNRAYELSYGLPDTRRERA